MKKNKLKTAASALALGCMALFSTQSNAQTQYGTGAGTQGASRAFFGTNAGKINIGAFNTFIGHESGFSNTTAGSNTFVGYRSGYLSTAYNNSFMGYGAGHYTTTGGDNSFMGYAAGFNNTTGNKNSFIGTQAGRKNTTGYNNSFMGFMAGYYNTTGNKNTYIGYYADGIGINGATLTNATAIGYNSKVSASNSLVLGGTGADAVNVGIGSTSPKGRLHVTGPTVLGNDVNGQKFIIYPRDGGFNGDFLHITTDDANGEWQWNRGITLVRSTGNVGIGSANPKAALHVNTDISNGKLGTIFGTLPEGNQQGEGTFLGVRGYNTTVVDGKSFAIEHSFYGSVNSSINFCRGGSVNGGFITFNTDNNSEKMRINSSGNVGIGTANPKGLLHITRSTVLGNDVNGQKFIIYPRDGGFNGDFLHITCDDGSGNWEWGKGITFVRSTGNVGIGTSNPVNGYKLTVQGGIIAEKLKLALPGSANWSDYVFANDYQLKPLLEIETFIKANKHLPGVPSAEEVVKNGIDIATMDAKLLEKIEELTLYMIEMKKESESQKKENETQNKKIEQLEKENTSLKSSLSNYKK